ncbi:hypothetical protein D9613_009974 [Agrocybe pediades]|uniref:Pentatricopeptide repeat-containing protein n=1 Tax=Agrocybe pediades TaxID=84607 RepID=A0A8H4QYG3_9AGAR|nr:hypothetical protein D9613_009974 [Agrocybe pediades]
MVPISWLLLRPNSSSLRRINLFKHTPVRLISSSPNTRYAAVLSFSRLAHSFVNTTQSADITPPKVSDFPINVIEKSAAIRNFALLVEENKLDEATAALSDILDAGVPDEDSDAFQQVTDILSATKQNEGSSALLVTLGLLAASKGRTEFVEDQVLPLLRQRGNQELVAELESRLNGVNVDSQAETSVFEDASEDYSTSLSYTRASPMSTLEAIKQQLPPILPAPSVQMDHNTLFEEEAEGQELLASGDHSAHAEYVSGGHLNSLIINGQYDAAFDFIKEMEAVGAQVPASPQYVDIAATLLRDNNSRSSDLAERALAWLSLMPASNEPHAFMNVPPRLQALSKELTSGRSLDIALLTRVSLIYASKGYVVEASEFTPIFVRCMDRAQWRKYAELFELVSSKSAVHPSTIRLIFRNEAIRAFIGIKRSSQIIELLQAPGDFKLSSFYIRELESRTQYRPDLAEALKSVTLYSGGRDLPRIENDQPKNFGNNFRSNLRYLKNMLDSPYRASHPDTIANFMHLSLQLGRTTGLRILLSRAYRKTGLVPSNFALAEMKLYKRYGHPELVLKTFVDHFFLTGLCSERILSCYNIAKKTSNPQDGRTRFERIYEPGSHAMVPTRMWPTLEHHNLLWQAMISITRPPALNRLYTSFVEWTRGQYDLLCEGGRYPDLSKNNPAVEPSTFHPFFRPLMKESKLQYEVGEQMLQDMFELGIQPHIFIYTDLVWSYASNGKAKKALALMRDLEQNKVAEHRARNGTTFTAKAPSPDYAFYVSLLRGLLVNNNLKSAGIISRRIKRLYGVKNDRMVVALAVKKEAERTEKERSKHLDSTPFAKRTTKTETEV